jgi:hypothetical protein
LMTYENAEEVQVLQSLWRPGAPLENTLFAILDPYGRPLTRGSRSPDWFFRDADDMARGMDYVAKNYHSTGNPQELPTVTSVRLGLNVAACDKLPLAIVVGDNAHERQALDHTLAPVAWSDNFIGKMTYTEGAWKDLRNIQGASMVRGYVFVSPNEFGTAGQVIAQLGPDASAAELKAAMQTTINRHHPANLDHREHIMLGRQEGIHWTSATPVTDPHQMQADQRDSGMMGGPGMGGPGMGAAGFGGPGMGGPGPGNMGLGQNSSAAAGYSRGQYPYGFGVRNY